MATGRFADVDYINVRFSTPTLDTLSHYQSVLLYSGQYFSDRVALGNTLDSYMRAGGGVVVGMFAYNYVGLRGAFINNYALNPAGTFIASTNPKLGKILLPNDPLMDGVKRFDGGNSALITDANLVQGAVAVANYKNGQTLIAKWVVHGFQTVNLNFYPPSSDAGGNVWNSSTDGTKLIANALENVGLVAAVPEPATWAMMLVGFAMIGSTLRRRKVNTRVSYAC